MDDRYGFPKSGITNRYARALLTENDPVSLFFSGDTEMDIVAGAEEMLRRAADPQWKRTAKAIGYFMMKGASNVGFAMYAGIPPEYHLQDNPPDNY